MGEIPNRYREDREKSPGEKEVEAGNYLVMIYRFLGALNHASTPKQIGSVEEAGELLRRRFMRKK